MCGLWEVLVLLSSYCLRPTVGYLPLWCPPVPVLVTGLCSSDHSLLGISIVRCLFPVLLSLFFVGSVLVLSFHAARVMPWVSFEQVIYLYEWPLIVWCISSVEHCALSLWQSLKHHLCTCFCTYFLSRACLSWYPSAFLLGNQLLSKLCWSI